MAEGLHSMRKCINRSQNGEGWEPLLQCTICKRHIKMAFLSITHIHPCCQPLRANTQMSASDWSWVQSPGHWSQHGLWWADLGGPRPLLGLPLQAPFHLRFMFFWIKEPNSSSMTYFNFFSSFQYDSCSPKSEWLPKTGWKGLSVPYRVNAWEIRVSVHSLMLYFRHLEWVSLLSSPPTAAHCRHC